ncbi:hypothetical protein M1506_02335 [Patescibacteria group bacterium]|nr:hypothetical protein [Patescibacteria group bacterium]
MEKEKLVALIKSRHILLDTNVFIKAFDHFDAFRPLFEFLEENNCQVVDFPLIQFEFTRNTFLPDHREQRELFLKKIATASLPLHKDLIKDALEIARIYAHQGVQRGQISLVDCCIAAYLMKYEKNLFLLTMNHKDFPTLLFNRVSIFPVDEKTTDDVFAPAFYQFDVKKLTVLRGKMGKVNNQY